MPKYNQLEENEEDEKLEMPEVIDEDIDNEIFLQENVENKVDAFDVEYKKDKHIYDKKENAGLDFSAYEEYTNEGTLTDTSSFLKEMKLEKGLKNVELDPALFNKAVMKVMVADFKRKKTVTETSKKTNFEVSKEKNSFSFTGSFDKESIILRAKELRAKAFNLVTGEGKPEKANPYFVREITEADELGNASTRLGYDYAAVNKLVNGFEDDEHLYQSAIKNIRTSNFRSYYESINYSIKLDEEGNQIYRFGLGDKESALTAVEECARDYHALKEIHESRPWYHFFAHPLEHIYEGLYLKDIRNDFVDRAGQNGFGEEMKDILDHGTKENFNHKLSVLKTAVEGAYPAEEQENVIEEINTDSTVRKQIEVENNLVNGKEEKQDGLEEEIILEENVPAK